MSDRMRLAHGATGDLMGFGVLFFLVRICSRRLLSSIGKRSLLCLLLLFVAFLLFALTCLLSLFFSISVLFLPSRLVSLPSVLREQLQAPQCSRAMLC